MVMTVDAALEARVADSPHQVGMAQADEFHSKLLEATIGKVWRLS